MIYLHSFQKTNLFQSVPQALDAEGDGCVAVRGHEASEMKELNGQHWVTP